MSNLPPRIIKETQKLLREPCDGITAVPNKWSPALQIRTVLLSIQALLSAPNPDDPLDNEVAAHWKLNEQEALDKAREWTRLYAKPV
ncbi:hypothetical protein EG68_04201 [Paragonimus skrjabini miyazakii]|uniref:UBC core domain-containing protein n=1 Tax=Paragonimus skrjabini miyazakii TaxID=59628 RepID=A0A8S9YUL6_9TREM|nr:hypothetical protein EG68_04201 [Paragonimus skrjabini miyazakii]